MCAEGEAECGAGDADSPPPLYGYAPGGLSPSHSRSYQELRPAPHARDMQTYAHLEEALFKPALGSTDGAYLRGRSPDLSPSPERRDDYRQLHYEPYAPAQPPPYTHEHHHHVDG